MTDANEGSWTGPEAEIDAVPAGPDRMLSLERQLQLVDRVKSLEAQLAQLSTSRPPTPSEQLSAEQQLLALRASLPWRVGRVVTIPVRIAQRMLHRGTRR